MGTKFVRRSIAAAMVFAALAVGLATSPSGADQPRGRQNREMARMHELMMEGNPGMARMHERMMEGNHGMARMLERMMEGNHGMGRMHERMMAGNPGMAGMHERMMGRGVAGPGR